MYLDSTIQSMVSGTFLDADYVVCINRAVREIVAELDLRSLKRKTPLTPNLFDDVFDYSCPTDLKGYGIVDIRPQINRGRLDQWRLTTEEEFDRIKQDHRIDYWGDPIKVSKSQWLGDSICAISDADFIRKLKLSRPINDIKVSIDPLDAVGTWVGFGDGTNLTADSSNYVKGSAAINWDINASGGTTAGIQNSSIPSFNISQFLTEGSVFVWAYLSDATNVTNFIVRIGSGSSDYNYITVTATSEGVAFQGGWNLLRFDFVNKSTSGSPTNTACTYAAVYMTKTTGKISQTDFRFDDLLLRKGDHYDLIYYSRYGWQSSAGVYKENSDTSTDYVNFDTDEIQLLEYKTAELIERLLRNPTEADRYFQLYQIKAKEYHMRYPSESLILTSTYHWLIT